MNITFQYDLKSAGTMVNQNIALTHRATCAIVENGSVACWGRGQLYSLGNGGDANTGEPILTSPMPDNRPAVAISAGGTMSVLCWIMVQLPAGVVQTCMVKWVTGTKNSTCPLSLLT